jgi:hypothetical protein
MPNDRSTKLTDVKAAFHDACKNKGHNSSLKGEPWVPNMVSHVQGIVDYNDYKIVSHNNIGYSKGFFMVLKDGRQLKFDSYDDDFNRPGGMQIIGDYMLVAVESSDHKRHRVRLYNLSEMTIGSAPTCETSFSLSSGVQGAAAVGITDFSLNGDKYLLATFSEPKFSFYIADAAPGITKASCAFVNDVSVANYPDSSCASFALLTDTHSDVYLVGFRSEYKSGRYKDFVDLYRVTVPSDGSNVSLLLLKSEHITAVHGTIIGPAGIHCRWGTGLKMPSDDTIE